MSTSASRYVGSAVAALALLGGQSHGGSAEERNTDTTVYVMSPDGDAVAVVPQGALYLVDRSVDEDGYLLNHQYSDDVPPICVDVTLDPAGAFTTTARVENRCAVTSRVKVVVGFGADSPCLILTRNATDSYRFFSGLYGSGAYFDGLRSC